MQCIVTYATAMYLYLPKINSEIQAYNLDTHHPDTLYLREQVLEVIFRSQSDSASKNVWETQIYRPQQ
jgi:hypothetical protein